jgi:hypothetical protein
LSWAGVNAIVARFAALNPYDRSVGPGPVLEIEDINHDPDTGERRRLWCFSISAKRYALFSLDADGMPQIPDDGYSEHGLGQLLNSADPDSDDREWIRTIWQGLICADKDLMPYRRPAASASSSSESRFLLTLKETRRVFSSFPV